MTAQELSNMVFAIKEKISDKEFKDIMDKLSVKNEKEDKPELYEFTYMKMREPNLDSDGNLDLHYNFCKYKIKTKDVVFEEDDQFKSEMISNTHNWLYTYPFMLTLSKTQKYWVLGKGCFGMCANSVIEKYCENPLAGSDEEEEDDCVCVWGCDKCIYPKMKNKKGATIRFRKMIGLSIKKK